MSKTKCWPGCIAWVTNGASTPGLAGRFVQVIREVSFGEVICGRVTVETIPGVTWLCRPASGKTLPGLGILGVVFEAPERPIADAILQPFLEPGEDAVDEMVLLVGAPDKVAA